MKRAFVVLAVLYGVGYYLHRHYHFHDALVFAKSHPDSSLSPAIDYYVGFAYYLHDDYHPAEDAFRQLLKDYPTGPYAMNGLFYLDDVAEDATDWDTARAALSRYVKDFPNGPDIDTKRQRLEYINYKHPAASPFGPQ